MQHSNATFSPHLTEGENEFLRHMTRWGSDGYPVRKVGRHWLWYEVFGVKGAPTCYATKKAACAAVEAYLGILRDKTAGRL